MNRYIFYVALLLNIQLHDLNASEFLSNIAQHQPTAITGSFFTGLTAIPFFVMSLYQHSNQNTVDMQGKSSLVQCLYPFILKLNEEGYTINPTTIHSKEYVSIALKLCLASLSFLIIGGTLTKMEQKFQQNKHSLHNILN